MYIFKNWKDSDNYKLLDWSKHGHHGQPVSNKGYFHAFELVWAPKY